MGWSSILLVIEALRIFHKLMEQPLFQHVQLQLFPQRKKIHKLLNGIKHAISHVSIIRRTINHFWIVQRWSSNCWISYSIISIWFCHCFWKWFNKLAISNKIFTCFCFNSVCTWSQLFVYFTKEPFGSWMFLTSNILIIFQNSMVFFVPITVCFFILLFFA